MSLYDDDNPNHLAYLARHRAARERREATMNDKFNESTDAREWASAFVETGKKHAGGMEKFGTDEGNMLGWFANAIMRGYDEAKKPLQKISEVLAVATDPGNAHADHYLRGMANGLILADHIVNEREDEIEYIEPGVVHEFDYMAEADKTCSVVFNPQNISSDDFVLVLTDIATACETLNKFKKLLVRGKTPEDVGFPMPKLHESLAVEFDPVNCSSFDIDLLHGIVGVVTEAGEMAEVLLHRIKTGEFDRVNAIEEVGDVSWYLARQLRGMNSDFETSNRMNIDKLHGRHGSSFDVFRDANRDLAAERAKLESAAPLFEQRGYSSQAEFDAVEEDIEDLDADNTTASGKPFTKDAMDRFQAGIAAPGDTSADLDKPPREYSECIGGGIHEAPEPGLVWHDGCWRREIVRDIPGLA